MLPDLLDVLILAAFLFFTYSGWRRGITWVGPSIIGLVLGVVAGALLATPIAQRLVSGNLRPTVAAGIFFGLILFIQGVGTAIGFRFRLKSIRTDFAEWDSILGGVLAAIGVLASVWYLGLTLSRSPWTWVDGQIDRSVVIRTLVTVAPKEPQFLTTLEHTISNTSVPQVFVGLSPLLPQVDVPAKADTAGIQHAANNTARIIAFSNKCGGAEAGSGWPMNPNYLVTNAHVVAGADRFEIDTPDGNQHREATVVFFDPQVDIAILHVPDLGMTALTILADPPESRTPGAVIGYPNGGDQKIFPAAVRGHQQAVGKNIYGDGDVTRDIIFVAGNVIQGDSGGPLVDNDGRVIGLVFATSTSRPGEEGYALSIPQITQDLIAGNQKTQAVDTGKCLLN